MSSKKVDKSFLVKIFGFPATLIHGDLLVMDRWQWLKKRLPVTANGETLIDIGCGSGAFSIGSALRGYKSLGLNWDECNQRVAEERTRLCSRKTGYDAAPTFEVLDVRHLDVRKDLEQQFDIAICCENIEHILDDKKLMLDINSCLKPGGRLLLTTPYYHYNAITASDNGPFSKVETGWHVRRGYTKAMLQELCNISGFIIEYFSFCGGILSQKITYIQRLLSRISPLLGWAVVLPLRPLPLIFEPMITSLLQYPHYSICMEAYKPRFGLNEMQPNKPNK
ncbi:MAG: methyltransferase domain-containing protein [Prochloron sp. SP5CPC1]|nr:methyltransferase domain-containing protein [Candidatus Paraprochloron terpiosi SP5CPC1]